MFHLITPHLRVESILELTVDRFRELGIDGVLLDLDCTLKRYRETDVRPETGQWLAALKAGGIGCCIVSNGRNHRIEQFADKLGLPFVANALKPFPFGVRRAMAKMGFQPAHTAMIGDQVFADVLAGRWAGVMCILVRPLHPEEEPWFTRIKRTPERLWLAWLGTRDKGRSETNEPRKRKT
ncbi:MAG: YqeG family HAD IIIA-type phosphatase [Thermoguttaceae bacterium]|jgi:HAD superfamily phosphatase (TIGR01668 family)